MENELTRGPVISTMLCFAVPMILGLAMGSGTVFSIRYGQKDMVRLK